MKIEIGSCATVRIDVQTKARSGGATKVFADERTEVYHGKLHTCVTFIDLGLEVVMDPQPGSWSDGQRTRQLAWEVLYAACSPHHLGAIVRAMRAMGHRDGVKAARAEIRAALGL